MGAESSTPIEASKEVSFILHGEVHITSRLKVIMQLLTLLSPVLCAVDSDCNYFQNMQIGVTYYIYNKEYPGNYGPSVNCLWRAAAPSGYLIEANCTTNVPYTPSCYQDRVLISLTGNPNLENAHTYCGTGSTGALLTESNIISMGLQSAYYSQGGTLLCTIVAKQITLPCNCGWKNTRRIVGGVETKVNEFPMMAVLIDMQLRDWYCGSTIISDRYVLTAAHCLKEKTPSITAVLVGGHNLSYNQSTSVLMPSIQFIIHQQYNPNDPQGANDIALVRTQDQISFNNFVGPVCLPFLQNSNSFAGETVEALGWGTTEFAGPKSDVLLKTDLKVLDYAECYSREGGTILQMCTYTPRHDSCQNDFGGPLLWLDGNTYRVHLVGITSLGFGCATYAALNTRVTAYIDWIKESTPEVQYCVI